MFKKLCLSSILMVICLTSFGSTSPDIALLKLTAAAAKAASVKNNEQPSGIGKEALEYLKQNGWEVEIFSTEPVSFSGNLKSNTQSDHKSLPSVFKQVDQFDLKKGDKRLQEYLRDTNMALNQANETDGNLQSALIRTQMLVASKENNVILSFRGSSNWQNWVFTDFFITPVWFYNTETLVHAGFALFLYEAINDPKFVQWYEEHVNQDTNFIITGHSLGAAVATLMTAKLMSVDQVDADKINLVTYAEPAPGQFNFAQKYNFKFKNYIWVASPIDPIVYITYPFDYYHFGIPYFLIDVSQSWVTHYMDNYYSYIMNLKN
ncbi:lipase family protein [Francisellaceae bacterium]|nr:lipase family protein [Francisellaceae bacterium]